MKALRILFAIVISMVISYASSSFAEEKTKLSIVVTYLDGVTVSVKNVEFKYQSNPGYVPSRYSTVDRFMLRKKEVKRNISHVLKKEIMLTDIKEIEFFANKDAEKCSGVIRLIDGRELHKRYNMLTYFDDKRTAEEFRGYYTYTTDDSLIGTVDNDSSGFFETELVCPAKKPDSIMKIVFTQN